MINAITKSFALFIVFLFVIDGCGGSFERPGDEELIEHRSKPSEGFEPLGMPEDHEIVPEKYPLIAGVDTAYDTAGNAMSKIEETTVLIAGLHEIYRIQLYTSKSYGPATREAKIAVEVFDREIYLDYEVPYYKVRCGDFSTIKEAEAYLPAAIEAGYKNAWVVKVLVNVQKLEDIYEGNIPPLIDAADSSAIIPEQIYDEPEYPEN
jgi:hypothetical protein